MRRTKSYVKVEELKCIFAHVQAFLTGKTRRKQRLHYYSMLLGKSVNLFQEAALFPKLNFSALLMENEGERIQSRKESIH